MELSLRISAISLQHFKYWCVHLEKLQNICTWNWNIKIKLNELMECVEFSLTGRKPAKTVSRWVNFVGFSVPEYNDTISVQFLCCAVLLVSLSIIITYHTVSVTTSFTFTPLNLVQGEPLVLSRFCLLSIFDITTTHLILTMFNSLSLCIKQLFFEVPL